MCTLSEDACVTSEMEEDEERVCFHCLAGKKISAVTIPVINTCLRPPKKTRSVDRGILDGKEFVTCFGRRPPLSECEQGEPVLDLDSFRAKLKPATLQILHKEPGAELSLAVANNTNSFRSGRFIISWQFLSKGFLSAPFHFDDARCQCVAENGKKIGTCVREAFLKHLLAKRWIHASDNIHGVVE